METQEPAAEVEMQVGVEGGPADGTPGGKSKEGTNTYFTLWKRNPGELLYLLRAVAQFKPFGHGHCGKQWDQVAKNLNEGREYKTITGQPIAVGARTCRSYFQKILEEFQAQDCKMTTYSGVAIPDAIVTEWNELLSAILDFKDSMEIMPDKKRKSMGGLDESMDEVDTPGGSARKRHKDGGEIISKKRPTFTDPIQELRGMHLEMEQRRLQMQHDWQHFMMENIREDKKFLRDMVEKNSELVNSTVNVVNKMGDLLDKLANK